MKSEQSTCPTCHQGRQYRYYEFLMVAFVTSLLCANLINPSKITEFFFGLKLDVGILFFPMTYLFGDILTEVYGYAKARRVIWLGLFMCAFAALNATLVVLLPPADGWHDQQAYEIVFGTTWRIVLASLSAYWVGEMLNAYVLAKIKIWMNGRFLFVRTIGSTLVGEGADSILFYHIAFFAVWDYTLLWEIILANYFAKVMWEIAATPITYKIINYLKKAEKVDHYDHNTNFSPFIVRREAGTVS